MKTKFKTFLALTLVVILAFSMAGCGSKDEEPKNDTNTETNTGSDTASDDETISVEGRIYGVSVMTHNNPFFTREIDGVKEALEDDPDAKVLSPDPAGSNETQIANIEEFLAKQVDVIIIDPIDSEGIKPALVSAERAGIPVIIIDSPVADKDLVVSEIASDNTDAGIQSARTLCEAIGGEGEIAIVNWSPLQAVRDRTDGLKKVIEEEYPDVEIVADQDAYGKVEEAQKITETFLQAHPNLKGIFAINDPTAQGVAAGLEGANKTGDIKVVSVDGSQNAIDLIKDGQLLCSPAQFPVEIGKKAVEVAKKVWQGEDVDKKIIVPVKNIDASNVDEYDGKQY